MIKALIFDDGFNEATVYMKVGRNITKQPWTPFIRNVLCKPHVAEYQLQWISYEDLPLQSALIDAFDYFDCHRNPNAPFDEEAEHFNLLWDWAVGREIPGKEEGI